MEDLKLPVIIKQATEWSDGKGNLVVTSKETYDNCLATLKEVKGIAKDLEDKRKELTSPINLSLKAINAMFKIPTDKLKSLESFIKSIMLFWVQKQERIRLETQRKADEEARLIQEKAMREEAEATRKAEELRAKGMVKRADKQEAKAEVALATAVQTVPEKIKEVDKGAGTYVVVSYSVVITDAITAKKYLAKLDSDCQFLDINIPALNRLAQDQKGGIDFPGMKVIKTESIRTRSV